MNSRRVYTRLNLSSTVFFLNVITKSIDVSMGGVQIKTNGQITSDNVLSIGMELPNKVFINLFGHMVWCRTLSDSEFLYGIQFIDFSDHNRDLLQTFLHEY